MPGRDSWSNFTEREVKMQFILFLFILLAARLRLWVAYNVKKSEKQETKERRFSCFSSVTLVCFHLP